ncbi:aldehyde dehydrogenase [Azospirillum himalayense]|uniref:Aldehyde dehydrogenase n=1 Tax=Azospirillum himalayense TaxID=654847 RepID=A0ABW0GAK0_9PROT
MDRFDNFIDGRFVPPVGGAYLETENPFTGKAWALIPRSSAADVDEAVAAAARAFRSPAWAGISATDRARHLRRLGEAVADHAAELAEAEVRDNGKTYKEMLKQLQNTAEWYHFFGGLADKITGEVLPVDAKDHLTYTRAEPLGVIGMITPWNSPLRLLAWKLAPALAAGNTAVIKPSEFTSTATLRFAAIAHEAGIPAGVINVVCGLGQEVGQPLADHRDVAKIAFTGGVGSGTAVYVSAARRLAPVTLELGGKSPNIVFADANLDSAATGVAAGIFASGGQSCVAGSRLLVQREVHDAMVERVVAIARGLRMGDPMHPDTHVGPVATRPQYERILACIAMALDEGAHLAHGGKPLDAAGPGLFIEPTVFTNVSNGMRIAQEEVFGPVLCVIPFSDEEDALRLANDSAFGLGAGVWTGNIGRAHRMAAGLQAGSVWVNTYRMTSQIVPFGGYKASGIGREGGADMIKAYLQTKSVWVNLNDHFASPFGPVQAAGVQAAGRAQ